MKSLLPPTARDKHVAILGKTGSGKTYAAKGVVEQLIRDERQVCVIDPTGAWWGLRSGADGKTGGLPIVLIGGNHSDIPLSSLSGDAVARLVTEQGASVVLDTSAMMVSEYERWFFDFAQTVYATLSGPLHLIIDEAHQFMPQGKVLSPQGGKMLHAGNRLMAGMRSRGLRATMISQRPAKLHKDSLSCADTLISMRVIAPQDRDAIKDWLNGAGDPKIAKEVLDGLAQLKTGEAFVWFPEGGYFKRTMCPPITTFDSSAAADFGATKKVKLADINLDGVKSALAIAVKEAEANDPKLLRAKTIELQRKIDELEKQVTSKNFTAIEDPARVMAAFDDGAQWFATEIKQRTLSLAKDAKAVSDAVAMLNTRLVGLEQSSNAIALDVQELPKNRKSTPLPTRNGTKQNRPAPSQVSTSMSHTKGSMSEEMPPRQTMVLHALAEWRALGFSQVNRARCAFMARRATSSSYERDLGALRTAGLIDYPSAGDICLTSEGARVAGTAQAPSRQDMLARIRGLLEPRQVAVLDALLVRHRMAREECAEASGRAASSSYERDLGRMRTLGLIDYPASGEVELEEWLR